MIEKDMEEIKKSLNFMSEEINKGAKQQAHLLDLLEEVGQLKIKEKDERIEDLNTESHQLI